MTVPLLRLPSLDLLRGYVAVGRRMSITKAAQDLCLTQSAVSRQIRALEEAFGVPLLVRGHRSIAFTAEGERLFRVADQALHQLQEAVAAIKESGAHAPVTVSCSIGVAGLWMLPRLAGFLRQHPEIDVRISASNKINNLRTDLVDLAIRYCPEQLAPKGAERLFGERVQPVAHASLCPGGVLTSEQLSNLVLLEYDEDYRPWLRWSNWFEAQGWTQVRPKAILRYNQYDQVIHAAVAGQGVALGRLHLIGDILGDGRLTVLRTGLPGPAHDHAYWLIRAEQEPRREVAEVAEWIRREAVRTVQEGVCQHRVDQ